LLRIQQQPRYNRDVSTRFEWDDEKDRANQRKHRISFARATQVFDDPGVVFLADRVVDGEERFQAIGLIEGIYLIVVVHAIRGDEVNEVYRIISARRAKTDEERIYEESNG
jgi:uncharacterized DUF497 family protein